MTVLVLAAHPDDEVLGCGGTIARFAREGHQVYIAILGEGITSRYTQREEADLAQIKALHERSQQVAEVLGATELFLYDLPDNRFDTVPLLDMVKIIETLVVKLQPQMVFTQHGGDLNIDHQILFRATLTATRPMEDSPVKTLYSYEVASSSEWAFGQFDPIFHPSVFIDISDTLDVKIRAMEMYESEARPFPHPRAPESLEAIARRWGSTVVLKAAESFHLVRQVISKKVEV